MPFTSPQPVKTSRQGNLHAVDRVGRHKALAKIPEFGTGSSWNRHSGSRLRDTGSPFKVIPAARSGLRRAGTRAAYSGLDTRPSALRASGTTQTGRLAVAVCGPRGLRPLGYRRSGPAAPGLRYPPCTAACMARAASSLRSGTGHASRYVVGNVHRHRCSNALPILRRFAPSLPSPRDGTRFGKRSSPALTRAMACCVRERRARITPSPRLPPRSRGRSC